MFFLICVQQKELKEKCTELPAQKHGDARHSSLTLKEGSKVTAALLSSTEK
jgi:hypothetical protein